MQRSVAGLLTGALVFALVILWRFSSPTPASTDALDEIARLRVELTNLKLELKHELERKVVLLETHANARESSAGSCPPPAPCRTTEVSARQVEASPDQGKMVRTRHDDNETLLLAHKHWDWKAIVSELLAPWPRIAESQVDSGVDSCHNSSMYCSRMQIYRGSLYITDYRAIFFDRHYAPARVMPILETLRRNPQLVRPLHESNRR